MKYIKYILLTLVLIVVAVLSTSIIYHYSVSKNKETNSIPNNIIDNVIDKDSNKDDSNSITNEEQENNDPIKEEQTSNIDEKPKVENNNSNNEKTKKENKPTNSSNSGTTTKPNYQPPKVEEKLPKEQTAWEELGISEYDYYHKPIWSWSRIDFSVDDYGTEENTKNACISKGNKLMKESQEGLGFSCQGILSYAGNYLGEMMETF